MVSIFIFRRDLRISDNTGLIEAFKKSKVIPLFILTPKQIAKNPYKSSNAIQFMMESLYSLDSQIHQINRKCRLWVYWGNEIDVLRKIYSKVKFDAIYVNEDYTPYSIKRDRSIERFCHSHQIEFHSHTDYLLSDTNDIKANNGNYYKVFTQFYKKSIKTIKVRSPSKRMGEFVPPINKNTINYANDYLLKKKYYMINPNLAIHGGRENGLKILAGIKKFHSYKKTRDYPAIATTKLSAHNKFGTVSIREVYRAFRKASKDLVKQLYWRDFYYYIGFHFPSLYKYQHITRTTHSIKWNYNSGQLKKWEKGQTGFPIVDAGMRELNTTGFMHNRCRMIVAMFLVKDLGINWKYGERYFSRQLTDIDRAQNTGNWNWSSSWGLDNTSFLRIFNPWTQSAKFDPNCIYIKKWIPELKDIPNKEIHQWFKYHQLHKASYPKPMVDHDKQRIHFLKWYQKYVR